MYINSEHVILIIEYSELDEEGEHGPEQTENVHILLDDLKQDAFRRAKDTFNAALALSSPSAFPASAVRPVEFPELDNPHELLAKIVKAPPALALALGRVVTLPKEKPGDEFDPDKFKSLMQAFFNWDPKTIKRHITPGGWSIPAVVGTIGSKPKPPGPELTLPAPEPEPEPDPDIQQPDDTPPEPEPEPEPEPGPDVEDPGTQEPAPNEPSDDDTAESDQPSTPQEPATEFPWKEVGKSVLGLSAVGLLAYSLFGAVAKAQEKQ